MSEKITPYMERLKKIVAISNHKGGVGKTTSVVNIGAGLNKLGKKVLLIDLDAQANLSQSLGLIEPEFNIYGAIKGLYPMSKCINTISETVTTGATGLDVIPSTLDLSGAEIELSSETGREYILKDLIDPLRAHYDFILIDCPPALSLLTINALTVANEVFIPLQAQYLALQGLTKLLEVISKIQKRLNEELQIGGVFITQFDKRKILNRDVVEAINTHFKDKVFNTKIRDNVALAEAPSSKQDIFRYNPTSNGAEDYLELSREILTKYKI